MTPWPSNPDVLVIGAGAAGIGAGLALKRLGLTAAIIEAKPRIGGRAHTDCETLGVTWDRGCHWFHTADRNPLRVLADRLGHGYDHDTTPPMIGTYTDGRWQFGDETRAYVWDRLGYVSDEGAKGRDVSAASLLDRSHRLYPLLHHWFTLMTSREPEEISAADYGRYDDSHVNLPVKDGYGRLMEKIARGLAIGCGIEARRITVGASGAVVDTSHGTITAKAVVIAVPARILQEQRIAIDPGYPDWLTATLDAVPMGHYEKVALLFDRPLEPPQPCVYVDIFDPVSTDTEPLNFEISPFGRPIAVAHLAGDHAKAMVEAGEAEAVAFVTDTLVRAFGSDLRGHILKAAMTGWTEDPYTRGGYSCALPGHGQARFAFAEPVHDRLFLAGEHTSPTRFATCHGAYLSGIDAAHRAAAMLGLKPPAPDPLWLIEPEMA
ncbi:monoamine oxidase [Rhodoligotrophos appendicifer]|uniref:flavin monoamine oxidase family protein n=1 Tax=Rhodoligotrophos appendicifer TaxID=987056 RepID=UPI001184A121|nr:NAD(P)/FAD-dependent oxidoreductase [Rhodoligotrophos appendicifer]